MNRIRTTAAIATLATLSIGAARAQAPAWPSRPITFITAFAPGNGPDVMVRAIALEIGKDTGATIVVEGRPGAATFLAAQAVARAQPDGYTFLITGGSTFTANRHLFKKLPYDPVKDFQSVTPLAKGPLVLVVGPSTSAKTWQELVAQARANPDKLTYAEASAGTRVASELMQRKGDFRLTRIPYKSSTQALPDLMGGQINMTFTDLTALRYVKEGKLRALALADVRRSTLIPEIPTFEELGIKDMDTMGFTLMMAAPAGTPMPIVERMRAMVTKAGRMPEVQNSFTTSGTYPFFTTPAEMSALIEAEAKMWGEMVKLAGMEVQ